MNTDAQRFVGMWMLVHSTSTDSQGQVTYPYGSDARGVIYYGDSGYMSVQIARGEILRQQQSNSVG
jgi:hypothetical protein